MQEKIRRIVDLILRAKYCVALTGAGISTESGIPDFRTPGKGLWEKLPAEAFSAFAFKIDPKGLYKHGMAMFGELLAAKPNPAHKLLAILEEKGLLKAVITQNIDGLHHKAGSKKVFEIHGHLRTGTCMKCGKKYPMDEIMKKLKEGEIPPRCADCKKVIKPDIVLFGNSLPPEEYGKSLSAARKCDLMLVLGSSLVVAPAGGLPAVALGSGAMYQSVHGRAKL
ncbi:Sir2 family NAD-dependent protein deacetylase, partial [bacterium]|nr:Sir2 family NAD-dependent protein deacetylase [bacterium]